MCHLKLKTSIRGLGNKFASVRASFIYHTATIYGTCFRVIFK